MKPGWATLEVRNGQIPVGVSTFLVSRVAPALFTANGDGRGVAAALACRAVDGALSCKLTAQCLTVAGSCLGNPIDLTGEVYLILYGTGIGGGEKVSASVGGLLVPAVAASTQFVGEDQVNVGPLPATLRGKGEVTVNLVVDQKTSNAVTITVQ